MHLMFTVQYPAAIQQSSMSIPDFTTLWHMLQNSMDCAQADKQAAQKELSDVKMV
jgi:hypothetical protein